MEILLERISIWILFIPAEALALPPSSEPAYRNSMGLLLQQQGLSGI